MRKCLKSQAGQAVKGKHQVTNTHSLKGHPLVDNPKMKTFKNTFYCMDCLNVNQIIYVLTIIHVHTHIHTSIIIDTSHEQRFTNVYTRVIPLRSAYRVFSVPEEATSCPLTCSTKENHCPGIHFHRFVLSLLELHVSRNKWSHRLHALLYLISFT